MEKINKIRLKHANLSILYHHIKTYLDCAKLGYLENVTQKEKELTDFLEQTSEKIHETMWDYYLQEGEILG